MIPAGQGSGGKRPGLLAALMAEVRPEFRAGVLVFDPADPVFGGPACRVRQCGRTARTAGLCNAHHQRWVKTGRPDPGVFAATAGPWHGHAPPAGCRAVGCGFGALRRRLCQRHLGAWVRAGEPDIDDWLASVPPVAPQPGQAACRVSFCPWWAHPRAVLCYYHHRRWKALGCPDLAGFLAGYERPADADRERADLTALPAQLRLEVQYALQCRRDEATLKTKPATIGSLVRWLAASGAVSLLDRSEQAWRDACRPHTAKTGQPGALLIYARRTVTTLAEGQGWDNEYPRDTWQLRRLGIDSQTVVTLQFTAISQPWLKHLAKRWTRWRLSCGLSPAACYRGVHAITRFAAFCAAARVTGAGQISRDVLERYLADLSGDLTGTRDHVGQVSLFLRDIRRHQWDTSLPATAMFFPEDIPRRGGLLPRALAEHIMAQVEDPASLSRWDNPAYQLITLILIRCGLRISDATGLPARCLAYDSDGAPYLRYYNRKMKREALVPIDEELDALIRQQRRRSLERWPAGTSVLFPRPNANIDGHLPITAGTYRDALRRWLAACDVRDEYGQPVRLTPHQWRHTLGTRLINKDVPQHVVQKILDHDSPLMTAHYARLSDKTIREHWEKARKVNAAGQPVQISPDGPLGDAAWAKQQLSRATQALPNGYCQLPVVKTCPHANACLTCPMFLTTPEFLPQHHAQQQATLQLITAAEAAGHARVAEMNKQVAANLGKIITALEPGSQDGQETAADAS